MKKTIVVLTVMSMTALAFSQAQRKGTQMYTIEKTPQIVTDPKAVCVSNCEGRFKDTKCSCKPGKDTRECAPFCDCLFKCSR
jgi:hypothetical protein